MSDLKVASIAYSLRCRIVGGEWETGQALPSTRALAAELKVARVTLKQVLAMLAGEGLVRPTERDAWRVTNFVRDGVMSVVPIKLEAAKHTPRAAKMVQELLTLRKGLAAQAIAQLLTTKEPVFCPISPHLGPLSRADLNGYPSMVEVLRAEESIWEKILEEQLGVVNLAIAQFVRECLEQVSCWGYDRCAAPRSLPDWMELEEAIVAKAYGTAMKLTSKLLADREPLWQLLATTPHDEVANAH